MHKALFLELDPNVYLYKLQMPVRIAPVVPVGTTSYGPRARISTVLTRKPPCITGIAVRNLQRKNRQHVQQIRNMCFPWSYTAAVYRQHVQFKRTTHDPQRKYTLPTCGHAWRLSERQPTCEVHDPQLQQSHRARGSKLLPNSNGHVKKKFFKSYKHKKHTHNIQNHDENPTFLENWWKKTSKKSRFCN